MTNDQNPFHDKNFLRRHQYKDSSNLNARAALHRRFATAEVAWHPWVFQHLELRPGEAVLECGAGPGWLWRENLDRIPGGCQITLTDLSAGMVSEAAEALKTAVTDFRFQTASIEALPFEDDRFDVVVANHMLYHVADRPAALAEVKRVLKKNGRFYAATNGADHMRELNEIGRALFPDALTALQYSRLQRGDSMSLSFRLENGHGQLEPFFSQVDLLLYQDSLRVTEAEPLVKYALSVIEQKALPNAARQSIHKYISQQIAESGAIHITKSTGLFVCRP